MRNANIIGLPVQGHPGIRTLTTDFINEALTISDLFELNELAAVDLLRMGNYTVQYFLDFVYSLLDVTEILHLYQIHNVHKGMVCSCL